MSRQVVVTVPEARGDEVVSLLQERCLVENVCRVSQEGITTVRCCVAAEATGFLVHHLDKAGVGVAFGEVLLIPVAASLPKRRTTRVRSLAEEWRRAHSGAPLRISTDEMRALIAPGAALTDDYMTFIACAAAIAAVGLGTNNTIMIVASMLVSPLMAPILAFTYATVIRDWRLFRHALLVLAIGCAITFATGFFLGLLVSINNTAPDLFDWPTDEMSARGKEFTLITGAIYAVPSGIAVALAAANPNVGAVVGVAIAASLLPPITNSGLCFGAYAAGHRSPRAPYRKIGAMSIALFGVNVACIFLCAASMFALKRVERVARSQLTTYEPLPRLAGAPPGGGAGAGGGGGLGGASFQSGKAELAARLAHPSDASSASNQSAAALRWLKGAAAARAAAPPGGGAAPPGGAPAPAADPELGGA